MSLASAARAQQTGYRLPDYAPGYGRHATPGQAAFHAARAPFRYLSGGLGSGKSVAGWNELVQIVLENAEERSGICAATHQRSWPLKYLCAAPNHDKLETGPWETAHGWLDEFEALNGRTLIDKVWTAPQKKIRLITGDVLLFVLAPGRFAGGQVAHSWYDECELASNPVAGFKMLLQRNREYRAWRRGIICTSTPPVGDFGLVAHFREQVARNNTDYYIKTVETASNPVHKGQDYIEQQAATMSPREFRAMMEGLVLPDEGVIYGLEYDPRHSFARTWKAPTGKVRIAIDWGGHYHALLIDHHGRSAAPAWDDTDVVFDEVVMDGVQTEAFIGAVVERCQRWGIEPKDVDLVITDEHPLKDRIQAYRVWHGKVQHRRIEGDGKADGIQTVRARLCGYEANEVWVRRLLFAPSLRQSGDPRRGILRCMTNYSWKKQVIQGTEVILPQAAQEQIWSHGADALRYYCYYLYDPLRFYLAMHGRR